MQGPHPSQRLRAAAAGLLLLAISRVAAAEPPPAPAEPDHPPSLAERERVRLVLLPTVVTDRRGRPVRDLTVDEFTLFEDGAPQEIRVFASEQDSPISLAFLLDVSESMGLRDRLGEAKRGIRAFVEALDAADRYGLIGFADDEVSWITPFTDDRRNFLRRLDVQDPGGKTALFDALGRTPAMVGEGGAERRAIVLFTDGLDNASKIPMLQAMWMARRVRVPIYALSFVPMSPALLSERVRDSLAVLERFSQETGGGLYVLYEPKDLDRAIASIQRELRQQYVIGYYPPPAADDDGTFRRIRLEAGNPAWTVRTRTGYYP